MVEAQEVHYVAVYGIGIHCVTSIEHSDSDSLMSVAGGEGNKRRVKGGDELGT